MCRVRYVSVFFTEQRIFLGRNTIISCIERNCIFLTVIAFSFLGDSSYEFICLIC